MRARAHAVAQNLTRRKRALVLLLLGCIFVLTGWVQQDTADLVEKSPMAQRAYAAHLDVMPLEVWGAVFVIVGAVAGGSGFAGRIPSWVGFAALQALSSFWCLLFIASYAQSGYGRAWISVLQWAIVVGLLAIIADWEDPPTTHVDEVRRRIRGGR